MLYTDHQLAITQGILGTCTSFATLAVAHLESVGAWLRIASLIVGICVGVVTIWSILRRRKK